MLSEKSSSVQPRIIIHGGAGNITQDNLPAKAYNAYRDALLSILHESKNRLRLPNATALDIATYAVSLLENNGLFNAGHGAVFTSAGTHELEASVMVSRGYRKRGVGVMKVRAAKNPIKLAREMLIRGEEEDGGGAGAHCQLEGKTCDRLAQEWGLETVEPSYFWIRRRWDQHRRGLGKKYDDETYKMHKRLADLSPGDVVRGCTDPDEERDVYGLLVERDAYGLIVNESGWDGKEYLPQGTVGAVVLDSTGTLCVATSTGGLTNKLPGRIGDTPTIGAGFWAEEWTPTYSVADQSTTQSPLTHITALVRDCLPELADYMPINTSHSEELQVKRSRAVAMSGTGNGDSFLRLNAVRTAAAIARYSSDQSHTVSLQDAITSVAGPNGTLQQSAEDRWKKTGEGEGGIIGIECTLDPLNSGNSPASRDRKIRGQVVYDFNCGGMWRTFWDEEKDEGKVMVFKEEYE